jgi:rare lipoprotein A
MTSRPCARALALAAACLGVAVSTATAAPVSANHNGGASGANGTGGTSGTSGGAGLDSTTTSSTSTAPTVTSVTGPVSAAGQGITLATTAAGTYRQALAFTGTVPASDSGDTLAIQRQTADGTWQNIGESTVAGDGSFSVDWQADASGLISFRASVEPPAQTAAAASATPSAASPPLAVTVYRNAIATIYGPGFYGHRTACGEKLRPSTIGVASRTLKCGTQVSIDYDGRSVTVPVIDRGPYANGASWDLTEATAAALSDPDTETVGVAVL